MVSFAKRSLVRCCLCLDLSKVFDTVRWKPQSPSWRPMTFPPSFALSSEIAYPLPHSVLNEVFPTLPFKNQRGIRQSDPLSPILFDMVMDVLIILVEGEVGEKSFATYWVNGATPISHLMYADDILLFLKLQGQQQILKIQQEHPKRIYIVFRARGEHTEKFNHCLKCVRRI